MSIIYHNFELVKKSYCPICNSKNLFQFLERNNVPVHQNLLMDSEKQAKEI